MPWYAKEQPIGYSRERGWFAELGQVAAVPLFSTSEETLAALQHFQSPFYCEVHEVLDDDHQIQVYEGEWGRIYFIAYDNEVHQLQDVLVDRA